MTIQTNNQKIYETLQDIARLANDCSQLLKGIDPARILNTPPRKEIIQAFLDEMNMEILNVYELLKEIIITNHETTDLHST